jgi:NADH:ubiquinone oxidoreductase subunit 5 (subunit L)/multisubunit Na+/H+ antiporter MnhA subunit
MALVRIFALVFTGEPARRRRFEPERIRDAGGRIALAMSILAIPCIVGGFRIGVRVDPIAFVTFPGVSLPNSHLVAAGVTAAAAVLGAVVAFVVYARRLPLPSAVEPVARALGEGLYVERAYRLAAVGLVLPASRAASWVESHVVDGALDLVSDSIEFAGRPRRWLGEFRIRPMLIGYFAGVVVLGTLAVVLAGGIIGKNG